MTLPPAGINEKAKGSTNFSVSVSVDDALEKAVGYDLHDLIVNSVPKSPENFLSLSGSERERRRKVPVSISTRKPETHHREPYPLTPLDQTSTIIPPLDSGFIAWRTLAVLVIGDAALYGFPLAYGVFQNYYYHKYHQNSPWIGLLILGIAFVGSPAVTYTCQHTKIPYHYFLWIGLALNVIGLTSSAFCSSLPALIITQGVIYGFGLMFFEQPSLLILNSWFNKHRGFAYGLLYAGCDLVGFAWSFLGTYLLRSCSFQTTMLIQPAIILVLGLPAVFLARVRPVASTIAGEIERCDLVTLSATTSVAGTQRRYFRRPIFYIFMACNFQSSLAYYLPYFYLPSFVTSLGYSASQAALVLAIATLVQIIGEVGFGELSDRFGVNVLVICSTLPATLSVFLLWGFARTIPLLLAFALVYGTFASGYVALYARMGMIFGDRDAPMVCAALFFGRGLSGLVSGPISEGLFNMTSKIAKGSASYGGKPGFIGVVLLVGSCMAGSTLFGVIGMIALRWERLEGHK